MGAPFEQRLGFAVDCDGGLFREHSCWRGQCFCDSPAFGESAPNDAGRKPDDFSPFCKTFGLSIMFNQVVAFLISCLLGIGSPATVARFVVTVAVDAVDGMTNGWTRPHVSQKRCERVQPPLANFDAPLTVAGTFRVEASSFHGCPTAVGRTVVPTGASSFDAPSFSKATNAAGALATGQVAAIDDASATASAPAVPIGKRLPFARVAFDCPFPKGLPNEVLEQCVNRDRVRGVHGQFLQRAEPALFACSA